MRKSWQLDRRSALRGVGMGLALPMLDAMHPVGRAASKTVVEPMRMLCIGIHLGFYGPAFFPKQTGKRYVVPTLLKPLERLRRDFTVFSGLDHPDVGKGHPATVNFLTGVGAPQKRKQISLDQVAANAVGSHTRFASLQLEARGGDPNKGRQLSFAEGGIPLPLSNSPRALFDEMFAGRRKRTSMNAARSVLDHVLEDANSLKRKLGKRDNEKLAEYLTAIRTVEQDLARAEQATPPNKSVLELADQIEIPDPPVHDVTENTRLMCQLITLAFQADLTRVVTLRLPGENHAVSHHGKKPGKVREFVNIQLRYMNEFARMLQYMSSVNSASGSLLDNTMVLIGSGMGNSSNHSTRNLPILVAGGGFNHGRHLSFTGNQKPPLSDLYVTMLQRMGIETDRFSSSRSSMNGLLT